MFFQGAVLNYKSWTYPAHAIMYVNFAINIASIYSTVHTKHLTGNKDKALI